MIEDKDIGFWLKTPNTKVKIAPPSLDSLAIPRRFFGADTITNDLHTYTVSTNNIVDYTDRLTDRQRVESFNRTFDMMVGLFQRSQEEKLGIPFLIDGI